MITTAQRFRLSIAPALGNRLSLERPNQKLHMGTIKKAHSGLKALTTASTLECRILTTG